MNFRCSYVNCKTGLPGEFTPVAAFKAKNAPKYMPEGHAIIADLRLCESCALSANIHEMIDNRRWADIRAQILAQGGTEPDRTTLRLMLGAPQGSQISEKLKDIRKPQVPTP